MKIKLTTIDEVKLLTKLASQFESDIFLKHGRYVVDATSLLGVISLNLDTPVEVEVVERKKGDYDKFVACLDSNKLIYQEV